MPNLYKLLEKRMVFLDGAFGTELQKNGLGPGDIPELWNHTHSGIIEKIHQSYIEVGADIINTNTFGGNRFKLKELGLDDRLKELNEKAVSIAKNAANGKALVAGSIGPTGVFLEPHGKVTFDEMYDVYREQVGIIANAGADIINFETMVDIGELRAAVLAAKDVCDLPVFASLTFDEKGRTLTGSDVLTGFNILEGLGVEFIGINCGMGPEQMYEILKDIRKDISARLVVQANAGLPVIKNGETVFSMQKEEYAKHIKNIIEIGVSVLGGCCGTTPEFIKVLKHEFDNTKIKGYEPDNVIRLSSQTKTVYAGTGQRFLKIGEKINPSASKKLRLEVKQENLSFTKELAKRQEQAGAHVIDINMGTSGIDETDMILKAVKSIQGIVNIPVCIDSTKNEAIEQAIKIYPGRALINSISGEKEKMNAILPVMKKYGSYAILLPLDENGIPETLEERAEIIERVVNEANKYGINKHRFLVDGLIMTVSAAQPLVILAIQTVKMAKEKYGMSTTAGLSNVSFGLPHRGLINSSYISMLIASGLDSAIINVENDFINSAISAAEAITGKDHGSLDFINQYKDKGSLIIAEKDKVSDKPLETQKKNRNENQESETKKDKLYNAIMVGDSDNVINYIEEHLSNKEQALDIVNKVMIPGIMKVGEKYDTGEYFLPQLMMSAETMKKGFIHLQPLLEQGANESIGKIILATVKGDVHDIGKNIVSIMFSNHGFDVIDLGKDVASEHIIEKAIENKASIIGLSALMTTTMEEMSRFMKLKNDNGLKIPVLVGGAVVNEDYANSIGAHYAKDAVRAVEKAKVLLSK